MSVDKKSHAILLTATLLASGNYTFSKIALSAPTLQPSSVLVMRGILCIVVYGVVYLCLGAEKIKDKQDWLWLFLCGVFGVMLNQIMFYEGLSRTQPINAAVMMVGSPIFVFLFSIFFTSQKSNWKSWIGVSMGATGALLLLFSRSDSYQSHWQGDLLILGNAASWGLYLIIVKKLIHKYHSITIVLATFVFGFVVILPYGYSDMLAIRWQSISMTEYLSLGYLLVFATLIVYWLSVYGMRTVSPVVAGSYIYLQPFMATLIAVALSQDTLDAFRLGCGILILAGVYVISKNR